MKIIFMGTPDFAVGTLRSLAEAGHEITLVVLLKNDSSFDNKAVIVAIDEDANIFRQAASHIYCVINTDNLKTTKSS